MAWITPVTDRTSGAYHTLTDQNRIVGNIDYLTTELTSHQLYTGSSVSKTSYTNNDYISVAEWTDILNVLNAMITALSLDGANTADDSMTYTNMNTVESLTLAIYNRYQFLLLQGNNNRYAGDNIYSEGTVSVYSAGLA